MSSLYRMGKKKLLHGAVFRRKRKRMILFLSNTLPLFNQYLRYACNLYFLYLKTDGHGIDAISLLILLFRICKSPCI